MVSIVDEAVKLDLDRLIPVWCVTSSNPPTVLEMRLERRLFDDFVQCRGKQVPHLMCKYPDGRPGSELAFVASLVFADRESAERELARMVLAGEQSFKRWCNACRTNRHVDCSGWCFCPCGNG